jgi:hypothetical protein
MNIENKIKLPPLFFNFLFTIKFLYYLISFPLFNLFVSKFIQSFVNSNLPVRKSPKWMQSGSQRWNIPNYYIESSDLSLFPSEHIFGYLTQCNNLWVKKEPLFGISEMVTKTCQISKWQLGFQWMLISILIG